MMSSREAQHFTLHPKSAQIVQKGSKVKRHGTWIEGQKIFVYVQKGRRVRKQGTWIGDIYVFRRAEKKKVLICFDHS